MHMKNRSNRFEERSLDPLMIKSGRFETCWEIPPEIGTGTIKEFRFKSGIQVFIHDYSMEMAFTSYGNANASAFGFRFCLSGNTKLDLHCLKERLTVKTGESGFFYFPSMEGVHEDIPKTHIYKVLILVEPASFYALMEDDLHKIPLKLQRPLEDKENICDPFNLTDIITPSMRMVLEQIIHCPYEGAVRRIFLEAKAMELIASKLDRLNPAIHEQENNSYLKAGDIDRIHFAGELLSKNLQTPPNIVELAKELGVSRTKLYNDFNSFYGTSPIEYLRIRRIEKARTLVKDRKLNMTQIAYSLGYSSSSHFAKAFREYFGMPPSRYRQNERC